MTRKVFQFIFLCLLINCKIYVALCVYFICIFREGEREKKLKRGIGGEGERDRWGGREKVIDIAQESDRLTERQGKRSEKNQ